MADRTTSLGVNVAGFLRGALGLGEAGRLYVAALERAGVPVRTVTVDPHLPASEVAAGTNPVAKSTEFTDLDTEADSPFNLVCVNAPELPKFHADVGDQFFEGRRTIGVWAWEVDALPAEWHDGFALVDEIWVYSRYVEEILRPHSVVPVVRMPLPVIPPADADPSNAPDLGLGDRFTFLFVFDFFSTMARKNPLGLIEAFKLAFRPGEGPRLIVKSINGDFKPERLAAVEKAAAGHPDVHVVDRFLSGTEKNGLMASCDCYVSLHRAEGFGLTMAEAMVVGKPVIATGWSGNTDFMTPANSWLVGHTITAVGPEGENYPPDGKWAEPDTEQAAAMMREVWEDREGAEVRARRGQQDVLEQLSPERVGEMAAGRLYDLRRAGLARPGARSRRQPPPEEGPLRQLERNVKVDLLEHSRALQSKTGRWRELVLRVMRPYTAHQDELNRVTAEALREIADRQAGFDSFTAELAENETPASRGRDLARMVAGMRARPASAHPAISFQDEVGRTVIGFDTSDEPESAALQGFEDVFRGSEELITERQQTYADVLGAVDWVLDLGCGRGEFLTMMRDHGVTGRGVELSADLVRRGRERGLDIEEADALEYLRGLEDDSVPAIFAAQVVEHLPAPVLRELLVLVEAKLEPGGSAIFETVNPHVPTALKAFWTDPTHHHPLFPEVLTALCRFAGFGTGRVIFPDASGNFEADVYESPDYAVLVTKRR